jgi:hypothetical protein
VPDWLTIYAKRPSALTPASLLAELRRANLAAPAEILEVERDAVAKLASRLDVEGAELDGARVHCNDEPIVVHRWTGAERVAEEVERIRARAESLPDEVQSTLDATVEVVGLEVGAYRDLSLLVAWEIARIVAQRTEGVVADADHRLALVDDRGSFQRVE